MLSFYEGERLRKGREKRKKVKAGESIDGEGRYGCHSFAKKRRGNGAEGGGKEELLGKRPTTQPKEKEGVVWGSLTNKSQKGKSSCGQGGRSRGMGN